MQFKLTLVIGLLSLVGLNSLLAQSVAINGPVNVLSGKPITYTSSVLDGPNTTCLRYLWSVTGNAQIIEASNNSSVVINRTGDGTVSLLVSSGEVPSFTIQSIFAPQGEGFRCLTFNRSASKNVTVLNPASDVSNSASSVCDDIIAKMDCALGVITVSIDLGSNYVWSDVENKTERIVLEGQVLSLNCENSSSTGCSCGTNATYTVNRLELLPGCLACGDGFATQKCIFD